MTDQLNTANKNTRDAFEMFKEHLSGADRVIVETKNAVGGMDATYLYAPAIQEAINTRADLAPRVKPLEWEEGLTETIREANAGHLHYEYYGKPKQLVVTGVRIEHHMAEKDTIVLGIYEPEEYETAAQADYERRILSALTRAPITPAQAAKLLRAWISECDPGKTGVWFPESLNEAARELLHGKHANPIATLDAALKAIAEEGE